MKYTKESIEKIKNDPIMNLFARLADKSLDDLIKEIESEYKGDGKLHWSEKNGTTKEEPITDESVLIITKSVYDKMIDQVFLFKNGLDQLHKLGLNIDFSNNKCLINPLLTIIIQFLTSVWNSQFASSFINLIFDNKACRSDFEHLFKIYE